MATVPCRNDALKEYELNYSDTPVSVWLPGQEREVDLEAGLYVPMLDGYGEGEDVCTLYQEALDWWETELQLIEESVRHAE